MECWDGDPSVRPPITNVLSVFEAASPRWVSSTSGVIVNLGLDRPTTQKPPTRESTFTISEAVWGEDRTGSVGRGVKDPREVWRSLPMLSRVECVAPVSGPGSAPSVGPPFISLPSSRLIPF